jgi:hypothetical protein
MILWKISMCDNYHCYELNIPLQKDLVFIEEG